MTRRIFSRRRLLGGLLASLAACLFPRSPRAAAPRHTKLDRTVQPDPSVSIPSYSYSYDGESPGGEVRPRTVYTYDWNGCLRSVRYG